MRTIKFRQPLWDEQTESSSMIMDFFTIPPPKLAGGFGSLLAFLKG